MLTKFLEISTQNESSNNYDSKSLGVYSHFNKVEQKITLRHEGKGTLPNATDSLTWEEEMLWKKDRLVG